MPEALMDAPAPQVDGDRFTGEILLRTRPKTYRKCVQLLAQGNSSLSIAHQLRMSQSTVAAIKRREAQTIGERKASLISIFANVAEISAERMEQLASKAKLSEAGICAGISTDKFMLLAGEPTQRVEVTINAQDIYSELRTIQAEIVQSCACTVPEPTDAEFLQLHE